MVLIYSSQGGCVDSWHMGNFKFQSFSWVLEKKSCWKHRKGNHLELSTIVPKPWRASWADQGLQWRSPWGKAPSLCRYGVGFPTQRNSAEINESSVLSSCLLGKPRPWVTPRWGLWATWVLTRPLKASSFPPEAGLTWLQLQILSTTS